MFRGGWYSRISSELQPQHLSKFSAIDHEVSLCSLEPEINVLSLSTELVLELVKEYS